MASYSTFGQTTRRRRRQAVWRVVRLLGLVALLIGFGGYAYQVGSSAGHARTAQLEADLAEFQDGNLDLRTQLRVAQKREEQAEAALAALRERYRADVPSGVLADLIAEVDLQLQSGVEPERLTFLVRAAGLTTACTAEPETRRLIPMTPVSSGPVTFVRFAERVTITGVGESARNEAGLAEAWYDPTRPIRLEVRTLDGAVTQVEGTVPFTHRMVIDRQEFRFGFVAGAGIQFVDVTAQVCPLPQADAILPDADEPQPGDAAAVQPVVPPAAPGAPGSDDRQG